MRTALLAVSTLLPVTVAVAQDPSLITSTDYGVIAVAGNNRGADGVPARTPIGPRGLAIVARAGNAALTPHASTQVRIGASDEGLAVGVAEQGLAFGGDNIASQVGTTGNGDRPTFGPHSLVLRIPLRPGTRGKVAIAFHGNASDGASAGATVDVDGDGTADFAARADGNPHRAVIDVVADRNGGIAIAITTVGAARASGATRAGYEAALRVAFSPNDIGGGGCEITPFGRPCGGRLAGRAAVTDRGVIVGLHVSGAAANALGAIVVGNPLDRPVPLPGSDCALLVMPTNLIPFRTDRAGDGQAQLRIPARLPLRIALQAITVESTRDGLRLASTNGLGLVCR